MASVHFNHYRKRVMREGKTNDGQVMQSRRCLARGFCERARKMLLRLVCENRPVCQNAAIGGAVIVSLLR